MKLIKDMTQQELESLVGRIVMREIYYVKGVISRMIEGFEKIERLVKYELDFPNTRREWLLKEVREQIKVANEKLGELNEHKE